MLVYNDNMGNIDKIIIKMKNTLAGHTYKDCEKVLFALGYELKRVKGSHHQFSKNGKNHITISKHQPVSKGAVKDVLKAWETYYEKEK